ncbi:hypothetical protein [Diaphorobacter caeni]|uniref:hypothetical protein n=1 Tax=Diaphorobacter caeni TaxID=2784387 RepID=UPI00188F0668|nr:hypothetical protein [Diaphorobacter caeni]MBF5003903.1 hypothetical protein [Diaphorobacter caeni]
MSLQTVNPGLSAPVAQPQPQSVPGNATFGGHSIRPATPMPARVAVRTALASPPAPALLSRVFGLTGETSAARAARKVREGVHATTQGVEKCIGALTTPGGSVGEVGKWASKLEGAASGALKAGAKFSGVLEQSVNSALSRMDMADIHQLKQALAELEPSLVDASTALKQLKGALDKGIIQQEQVVMDHVYSELSTSLDLAMAQVSQQVLQNASGRGTYDMLHQLASDALMQCGYGRLPPDQFKELSNAVLLQAIDLHVDPEAPTITQQQTAASLTSFILNSMPSADMYTLLHTQTRLAGEDVGASRNLIMGAVTTRADQLENSVLSQLTSLSTLPRNLPTLASDLSAAHQTLKQSDAHAELNHLHRLGATKIEQQVQTLAASLATLTHAEVASLSDDQVITLLQSLKEFGIQGCSDELKARASLMKSQMEQNYAAAFAPVSAAFRCARPEEALVHLEALSKVGDDALKLFMALGSKIDGEDQLMELRESLMLKALMTLESGQVTELAATMRLPVMNELCDTLSKTASNVLMDDGNFSPALGKEMMSRAVDLRMLRHCVALDLEARDMGAATPPKSPFSSAAAIVGSVYGVIGDDRGLVHACGVQILNTQQQARLDAELQTFVQQSQRYASASPQGAISKDLRKDLTRATPYAFTDASGNKQPLANPVQQTGQLSTLAANDLMVNEAEVNLLKMTGGDVNRALTISRILHQGLLSDFDGLMNKPGAPITLPDGRNFMLGGSHEHSKSFHVESDGHGGHFLNVTYTLGHFKDLTILSFIPGDPIPTLTGETAKVNPDASFISISGRIHCDANGTFGYDGPVSFASHFELT